MQAERLLHYKKEQLTNQVMIRRNEKIAALRAEVMKVRAVENRKRAARNAARNTAVKTAATVDNPPPATTPTSPFIDLVSSSSESDGGEVSPPKRSRDSQERTRLPPPTPPDGTFIPGKIVKDTPLMRLLLRLQQEHHGDVSVYPPPCCDSNRCGYSTGCLHGQRQRLAKRLVEIECVLYGKNPENYILD